MVCQRYGKEYWLRNLPTGLDVTYIWMIGGLPVSVTTGISPHSKYCKMGESAVTHTNNRFAKTSDHLERFPSLTPRWWRLETICTEAEALGFLPWLTKQKAARFTYWHAVLVLKYLQAMTQKRGSLRSNIYLFLLSVSMLRGCSSRGGDATKLSMATCVTATVRSVAVSVRRVGVHLYMFSGSLKMRLLSSVTTSRWTNRRERGSWGGDAGATINYVYCT